MTADSLQKEVAASTSEGIDVRRITVTRRDGQEVHQTALLRARDDFGFCSKHLCVLPNPYGADTQVCPYAIIPWISNASSDNLV